MSYFVSKEVFIDGFEDLKFEAEVEFAKDVSTGQFEWDIDNVTVEGNTIETDKLFFLREGKQVCITELIQDEISSWVNEVGYKEIIFG